MPDPWGRPSTFTYGCLPGHADVARRDSGKEFDLKIALVGGTGIFGKGLATRLAAKNEVFIGSRSAEKARETASALSSVTNARINGDLNAVVARTCDVSILAVPDVLDKSFLEELSEPLGGKLVISPIVPIVVVQGRLAHGRPEGSAVEVVASILARSKVAAALHTIPAATMADLTKKVDFDVPVCADSEEIFREAAGVISSVDGFRPLYAGPLSGARTVESLTPMILNVAKLNHLKRLSIKFVS